MISYLLEKGASVNCQSTKDGESGIAALHSRLVVGGALLLRGGGTVSALHKAAWLGGVDSIELLCQKGAEVDIKSKSYAATPLSKVRRTHIYF